MDSRDDKKIEQIVNAGKPARLEPTLEMVKHEAVRRCVEDRQARVVYALPDGSLQIRLPMENIEGNQTSLCYVDKFGNMVVMGDDFDNDSPKSKPVKSTLLQSIITGFLCLCSCLWGNGSKGRY